MRITEATPSVIGRVWERCALRMAGLEYVDEKAGVLVDTAYAEFEESLVLARVFMTVPYGLLPERQRAFADEMARVAQEESQIQSETPVHSLLATRGCQAQWNDPAQSRGHVAIPLVSESFVGAVSMMSWLLRDLGLPLTWVQGPGAAALGQTIGSEVGFSYVEDARSARDECGRLLIPDQSFVAEHSVGSVFAVGGVVYGGAVLVMILFCRERVETKTVRLFMPLINFLKAALIPGGTLSRVFHPAECALVSGADPRPGSER